MSLAATHPGHEHLYERFAPQTPSGVADPNGIRQFTAGTGSKSRDGLARTPPRNAEARTASVYGVLTLTLHPDSYDWRFVVEAARTFSDTGSHAATRPDCVAGGWVVRRDAVAWHGGSGPWTAGSRRANGWFPLAIIGTSLGEPPVGRPAGGGGC